MFKNKEYILAIVREGTFSKAAEKLFVSQPSLSATVKRLEEKLGAPIFDRTTTPVGLTELGREYVKCATEIEQREEDFKLFINRCTNLTAGEVKIGASSLFSSFLLPSMIEGFRNAYPLVTVRIFENNTKDLLRELAEGDLDIVIDNAVIKAENILSSEYSREMILLALPDTMPISEKLAKISFSAEEIKNDRHRLDDRAATLDEFSALPFIILNAENDTGKRAINLFKKHSIKPNVLFKLDQQITAYNISSSGMGACFVSDVLVKNAPTSQNMRYFKLADNETNRSIYIYRKSNRYYSVACQKFVEYNTSTKVASASSDA